MLTILTEPVFSSLITPCAKGEALMYAAELGQKNAVDLLINTGNQNISEKYLHAAHRQAVKAGYSEVATKIDNELKMNKITRSLKGTSIKNKMYCNH